MQTIPDPRQHPSKDLSIAVIGGGAAGFFAALNTAEKNRTARIVIFEAGQHPLQKVSISGGGRCNVTHACFDPLRLTEFYPRGQKELRSVFARFQPQDTIRWFADRGLKLKTEEDGRLFPVTDRSADVIALFRHEAERARIDIRTRTRVEAITPREGGFDIRTAQGSEHFDVCILSTGYSPPGWTLAEKLGHSLLPPVPSLFPLTVKAPVIAGLQGISVPQAAGKLTVELPTGKPFKTEAEGPLLITHTGLSGPLIYRLSAWGARALAEARYQARLQIDWLPGQPEAELLSELHHLFSEREAKRKIGNTSWPGLSHRLWLALLEASGLNLEERGETVGKKQLNRLIENLKRLSLPVSGKSPSKEEFVSCGGVPLNEVDFKTMQSRRVPNLYFGGEILNIDGLTGGFNFQACWSEGWIISEALAEAPKA